MDHSFQKFAPESRGKLIPEAPEDKLPELREAPWASEDSDAMCQGPLCLPMSQVCPFVALLSLKPGTDRKKAAFVPLPKSCLHGGGGRVCFEVREKVGKVGRREREGRLTEGSSADPPAGPRI